MVVLAVGLAVFLLCISFMIFRIYVLYKAFFLPPCRITKKDLDGEVYDFVIVGGGTAGCILASRLSEDRETKVLLVEAGQQDDGLFFRLKILGATFMATQYHWGLFTQPEHELIQTNSKRRGRVLIQCRAKCLGGCSSLNLAIWNRGRPEDYDRWKTEHGCKDWDYKKLEPYFDKCEGKGPLASKSGFFSTAVQRYITQAGRKFEMGCAAVLGTPILGNYKLSPNHGVGRPYSMDFADGTRCNAVRAYLTRVGVDGVRVCDRPNLTIATGIRVTRVNLDEKNMATGVEFVGNKKNFGNVQAKSEVLVCAGTIHSPYMLMHSGIGPKGILEEKGLKCKVDLQGVGENLKDVASSGVVYAQNEPSIDKLIKTPWSMGAYALGIPSPLHSNTLDSFAFTALDGKEGKRPEVMLSLQTTRFPFACVGSYTQCVADGQTGGLPDAFTIHATLLKPSANGNVTLASSSQIVGPRISHKYLSTEKDMKAMIQAIKLARRIGNSKVFDGLRGAELLPGPNVKSDEEIEDYLRKSSCHFFGTLVGTCKMGSKDDPKAVVDSNLCVRGTTRLRVVDASIIPAPISGFTHAAVAAVAERASDLIKNER